MAARVTRFFWTGGPGVRILFGGEGEIEVGVIGEDVAFDSRGDRGGGGEGEAVEEGGVGVVGEAVAGGADGVAGIEIAVGEGVARIAGLAGNDLRGVWFGGERLGGGRIGMGVGGGGLRGGGFGGGRRGEAAEGTVELVGGDDDGVDVVDFGLGGGAFDGGEFERADTWEGCR